MNALELLINRRSASRLTSPAPEGQALQNIIHAGMRVPDHGGLQPWRFIVVEKQGLERFSQLLERRACELNLDEKAIEKARLAPFRAPLIITVVAHCELHPTIPQWEQVVSAGCAVMAMQMAALAQGFNGVWRSGNWTEDQPIREAFGCRAQDAIVGFLYLGTPQLKASTVRLPPDVTSFVSYF